MIKDAGIVWIASYPKSGNTWVRVILASLLAGGRTPDFRTFGEHCPSGAHLRWLERTLDVDIGDMTPPELVTCRAQAYCSVAGDGRHWLKVHDCFTTDLFPLEATAASVYIVRDPRDIAPSFADHMNTDLDTAVSRLCEANYTMANFGKTYQQQAPQMFGSWSQNVRSWLDAPRHPLLVIRYEDLLTNPVRQIMRLAQFLALPDDPDIIETTAKACAFDTLRQSEREFGFKERREHQAAFFRQGRAGAWRQILSEQQAGKLWNAHREAMLALGYGEDGIIQDLRLSFGGRKII